jgi:hypothetical protein
MSDDHDEKGWLAVELDVIIEQSRHSEKYTASLDLWGKVRRLGGWCSGLQAGLSSTYRGVPVQAIDVFQAFRKTSKSG